MSNKKIDVDRFVDFLEMDDEIAAYDSLGLKNHKRDSKGAYRKCPRCGSRQWERLFHNDYGKATSCDLCNDEYQ